MKKQGKDLNVLHEVVEKLAKGEELETKYKNHRVCKKNCVNRNLSMIK